MSYLLSIYTGDFSRQNTRDNILRLCHLTIFFDVFSLKAEWMYSQSKGRLGQHEELLRYLLSFYIKDFSRQNTRENMLRLCYLMILKKNFSHKAEWMYSQSKGRLGQHEKLLRYLSAFILKIFLVKTQGKMC